MYLILYSYSDYFISMCWSLWLYGMSLNLNHAKYKNCGMVSHGTTKFEFAREERERGETTTTTTKTAPKFKRVNLQALGIGCLICDNSVDTLPLLSSSPSSGCRFFSPLLFSFLLCVPRFFFIIISSVADQLTYCNTCALFHNSLLTDCFWLSHTIRNQPSQP